MRDRIIALFAATAVGLAPASAGESEHRGGDSRTDEVATSEPAPTPEELAGATCTGIGDQGPVTLSAGKWEDQPLVEGGASVPALWRSEGFHLTGDLDRVQIRAARIDGRSVVIDVLQAGPEDGMCCPRQLATRTFGIQSGKLVETDIEVTGTASLAMLDGTAWVLRKLYGQEGEALPGRATLAFASGKVSGSTGCNQFQGTVSEAESATSLVIGPLITTRKACPEPLMAQEHAFLKKLGQTEVFQFLFGDLVLSGANGALVFSPRID
jgi:heat shock protein HslJ